MRMRRCADTETDGVWNQSPPVMHPPFPGSTTRKPDWGLRLVTLVLCMPGSLYSVGWSEEGRAQTLAWRR